MHVYKRDPQTALAPQDLKSINPFGTAPYFRDTNVTPPVCLSESGAIVDYILTVYGPKSTSGVRLVRTPDADAAEYGQYLQWLHFANASLQATVSRDMVFLLSGLTEASSPIVGVFKARTHSTMQLLNDRLAGNKYLAGAELSAADIMSVVSLTTMRGFVKLDLGPYPNILRYLKDVAERPAYREALRKGDFGMEPMIASKVKGFTQFPIFSKALADD